MTPRIINLVLLLAIATLFSCNSPDHIWNETSNNVAREVRQTLNAYLEDINRDGFLAEFKYLDSSDMFAWHPPGFQDSISFDSVATLLRQNALLYRSVELKWDSLTVIPQSGTKAMYRGITSVAMTDTTGQSYSLKLQEEGIVIKKDGRWKLVKGKTVLREN